MTTGRPSTALFYAHGFINVRRRGLKRGSDYENFEYQLGGNMPEM